MVIKAHTTISCCLVVLGIACTGELGERANERPGSTTPTTSGPRSPDGGEEPPGEMGGNADMSPDQGSATLPPAGADSDGDGLPDRWELRFAVPSRLDPTKADSDDDGVLDGDEDEDGDGLTVAQEYAASRFESMTPSDGPDPFRLDLLIELDMMAGKTLSNIVYAELAAAYAALPIDGIAGRRGVGVHVYIDERDLEPVSFSGEFAERNTYFADHGPTTYAPLSDGTRLPVEEMVHVVVASRRRDLPERGAEVVTDRRDIEKTGIFLYYDALDVIHPQCGLDNPPIPYIELEDALAGSFIHELGHVLQLGHDTEVRGGVNTFNVMSIATSCMTARERFFGEGNTDVDLGNTEAVGASRFSRDAADLMRFDQKLSVDTSTLVDDNGLEM